VDDTSMARPTFSAMYRLQDRLSRAAQEAAIPAVVRVEEGRRAVVIATNGSLDDVHSLVRRIGTGGVSVEIERMPQAPRRERRRHERFTLRTPVRVTRVG